MKHVVNRRKHTPARDSKEEDSIIGFEPLLGKKKNDENNAVKGIYSGRVLVQKASVEPIIVILFDEEVLLSYFAM